MPVKKKLINKKRKKVKKSKSKIKKKLKVFLIKK